MSRNLMWYAVSMKNAWQGARAVRKWPILARIDGRPFTALEANDDICLVSRLPARLPLLF